LAGCPDDIDMQSGWIKIGTRSRRLVG
jgi:hypothetical protein